MDVPRWAEELVRESRVARLATVDEQGRPHVVPVVFVYGGDVVYTPLDLKPKSTDPRSLRRVRNILANPRAQLLVDYYDEGWSRLAYVQLRGRAEVIDAGEEHARAAALLEEKYAQYRDLPLAGRPVIALRVERVVTWRAAS